MKPSILTAAALSAAALVGCGGGEDSSPPPPRRAPIPPVLRAVESAAEDTIDDALAGERRRVVVNAVVLRDAADGPAADTLRRAGVSAVEIAEFQRRARRVAALAPRASLLRVALASNHAFAMVPGFFARYRSRVPADVQRLDNLDFEAKLRAKAGDDAELRAAAAALGRQWAALRPGFVRAGGARVAPRFDAHVARLRRLGAAGDRAAAVREAQHGLDLVDELESVYA